MPNRILVIPGAETVGGGVKFAIPEKRCRVLSISTTFTTSAAVASRLVFLTYQLSGLNVVRVDGNTGQAASLAKTYTFAIGADRATNPNLTHYSSGLPTMELPPVAKVEVFCESIDAADAFTNSVAVVEVLE
jgi:hypothetical protein